MIGQNTRTRRVWGQKLGHWRTYAQEAVDERWHKAAEQRSKPHCQWNRCSVYIHIMFEKQPSSRPVNSVNVGVKNGAQTWNITWQLAGKGIASGYVECIASGYASCIASGYLSIIIIIIIITIIIIILLILIDVHSRHIPSSSLSSSCWPSWGVGGRVPRHHVVH